MKGKNTLQMNNATLREAIQMWVHAKFANPWPHVQGVKPEPDHGGGGVEVTLVEPEDEENTDG